MNFLKKLITMSVIFLGMNLVSFSMTREDVVYRQYIMVHNNSISDDKIDTIIETVDKYSNMYKVPKIIIFSVMQPEHYYDAQNGLTKGGIGPMQVTKTLAKAYRVNRNTIDGNIHAGVRLLSETIKEFGLTNNAVAAYHKGIRGVQKYGYINSPKTIEQVRRVVNELNALTVAIYGEQE